jgi:hypothetical protein
VDPDPKKTFSRIRIRRRIREKIIPDRDPKWIWSKATLKR